MARVDQLPSQAIIDGFFGIVDFYLWKGIPCARRWPRWKTRTPSPAEKEAQDTFAYVNAMTRVLPPYVIDQYRKMVVSTAQTWKDVFVRGYLAGTRHK